MISMILGLPRWAKLAGIGALLVIAALVFINHRENAAVKADRAKAQAESTERALRAERAAEAHSQAIQAANATEAAKTRDAMKEAEDNDPQAARAPAGAVARAAAERLRARQAAKPSPAR